MINLGASCSRHEAHEMNQTGPKSKWNASGSYLTQNSSFCFLWFLRRATGSMQVPFLFVCFLFFFLFHMFLAVPICLFNFIIYWNEIMFDNKVQSCMQVLLSSTSWLWSWTLLQKVQHKESMELGTKKLEWLTRSSFPVLFKYHRRIEELFVILFMCNGMV